MSAKDAAKKLSTRLTSEQFDEMAAKLHIAAEAMIAEELGEDPSLEEISYLLAATYGDAWGLTASSGGAEKILALNGVADHHAKKTIQEMAKLTCEGSA